MPKRHTGTGRHHNQQIETAQKFSSQVPVYTSSGKPVEKRNAGACESCRIADE
jgi:hypothetical protein